MLHLWNLSVKSKADEHVLSYFSRNNGWESENRKANLKIQLKSFDHMPSNYAKGVYMAQGGTFLVYYDDQRAFIKKLLQQTDEQSQQYDDVKVFETYVHIIGKAVERLSK